MLNKLRLPVPISALLACSQTLVWTLFALGAWKLWRAPFPLNCLLIASWGTLLFWLEWSVLPLWGTAQNVACPQPVNHPFIAFFGAAGGTWSLITLATLFSVLVFRMNVALYGGARLPFLVAIAALFGSLAFIAALEALFLRPKNPTTLRVATFGWAGTTFDALTDIPHEFQVAAKDASAEGARLLVTPESAIYVHNRTHFRVALSTLAQRYNLALAIGYFDQERNENCIDFVTPDGNVIGRYVKTHLVPLMERYTKGKGDIALMEVDGIKIGGLICQDDNFPDIARKYALAGAQLLVVPTNDWKRVKDIHLCNHLWRALEFRVALVRAASDGISAITSADARIEAKGDHFNSGNGLLISDVRVGTGKPTLYARTGDWFPIACAIAALIGLILTP